MKITVQCECGNNAIMQVKNRKTIVVRDNLERGDFYCEKNEIKEGKTKKLLLQCNRCKSWIILDMD